MSGVTAKDLRDTLTEFWFGELGNTPDDNARGEAELAAFDAMAEKAENYDKLMALLTQNLKH